MKYNGPGRYDEVATIAMQLTGARAVILCVIGGIRGEGFEVHSADPAVLEALPSLMREMADKIERGGG